MSDEDTYQPPESLAKRTSDFFQQGDYEHGFSRTLPLQVQAEARKEAAQQTEDPDFRAYARGHHRGGQ